MQVIQPSFALLIFNKSVMNYVIRVVDRSDFWAIHAETYTATSDCLDFKTDPSRHL